MPKIEENERKHILDKMVRNYVQDGFRVVSQTNTTAQLLKPKKFGFLIALLSLLLFGIGFIIYLLYYMAKKDKTVYIEVDEFGNINVY